MLDLDRPGRVWRVREGNYYLFHLEPPLDENPELASCLIEADERYPGLRRALGQVTPAEDADQLVKANYWLHAEPLLPPVEVRWTVPAPDVTVATGQVTPAGIHFGQRGMRWRDLADKLLHEEAHAAWLPEVGGAPSLLNEGVATWFELRLSPRDRLAELGEAWRAAVANGGLRLSELARNPAFWAAYRRGLPVYEVGASRTGYLIEAHGLPVLKTIFHHSSCEDEHLAELIERQAGVPLETIEARIGAWLAQGIARPTEASAPEG